jgi:hypothetical protein
MIKVIYTAPIFPVISAFKSYALHGFHFTGGGEINIDRGVEGGKLFLNADLPC